MLPASLDTPFAPHVGKHPHCIASIHCALAINARSRLSFNHEHFPQLAQSLCSASGSGEESAEGAFSSFVNSSSYLSLDTDAAAIGGDGSSAEPVPQADPRVAAIVERIDKIDEMTRRQQQHHQLGRYSRHCRICQSLLIIII